MSTARQVRALLYKTLLGKLRNFRTSLFEILCPLFLIYMLVVGHRFAVSRMKNVPDTTYASQTVNLQSFVDTIEAFSVETDSNATSDETCLTVDGEDLCINTQLAFDIAFGDANQLQVASTLTSYHGPLPVPTFDQYVSLHKVISQSLDDEGLRDLVAAFEGFSSGLLGNIVFLGKVAFAPDTPGVRAFRDYMSANYTQFDEFFDKIYTTEDEALQAAVNTTDVSTRYWGVLVFNELDPINGQVDYTIRSNYSVLPSTKRRQRRFYKGLDNQYQKYYLSGFLTLQHAVETYLLDYAGVSYGINVDIEDIPIDNFQIDVTFDEASDAVSDQVDEGVAGVNSSTDIDDDTAGTLADLLNDNVADDFPGFLDGLNTLLNDTLGATFNVTQAAEAINITGIVADLENGDLTVGDLLDVTANIDLNALAGSDLGNATINLNIDGNETSLTLSELVRDLAEFITPAVNGEYAQSLFYGIPMPTSSYNLNPFYEAVGPLVGLVLTMSMLYPASRLVKEVVEEKESKMKETMKIMGLQQSAHILSWVIFYFFWFTSIAFFCTIMLYGSVLQKSDFSLCFLFFFLFTTSIEMFCFLASVFLNRAKIAGIITPLLLFICVMPRYAFFTSDNAEQVAAKSISLMLSPTAFAFGGDLLMEYEGANLGLQWENINDDTFPFSVILLAMFLDTILYAVLAFYFENVLQSQHGSGKSFFFLCQKSFWCGSEEVAYQQIGEGEGEGEGEGDGTSIEMDTLSLPVAASSSPSRTHPVSPNSNSVAPSPRSAHRSPLSPSSVSAPSQAPAHTPAHVEAVPSALNAARKVSIRGLRKEFVSGYGRGQNRTVAVKSLDLDMYENQITALLGHNGAGKTTTISMLTGLIPPSRGDCSIYGQSVVRNMDRIRNSMGVCPQHDVLFASLTCIEHLRLFATLKGVPADQIEHEASTILREVGLSKKRDVYSTALSGGMKRKLSVAMALIGDSKVVFLDEPTSGMDPYSRRATWNLLQKYRKGRVIVLTTHFMDEADLLGDRIAIMSHGELVCVGSSLFLKARYGVGYNLTMVRTDAACSEGTISTLVRSHVPVAKLISKSGGELAYQLPLSAVGNFANLFREVESRRLDLGIGAYGISITTLEEVFMRIAELELQKSKLDRLDEGYKKDREESKSSSTSGRKVGLVSSRAMNGNSSPSNGSEYDHSHTTTARDQSDGGTITFHQSSATGPAEGGEPTAPTEIRFAHGEHKDEGLGSVSRSDKASTDYPSGMLDSSLAESDIEAEFSVSHDSYDSHDDLATPHAARSDFWINGSAGAGKADAADAENGEAGVDTTHYRDGSSFFTQFVELFRKRYICAFRDYRGRFFEIIFPVLIVAAVLLILRLNINPAGPPMKLNFATYNGRARNVNASYVTEAVYANDSMMLHNYPSKRMLDRRVREGDVTLLASPESTSESMSDFLLADYKENNGMRMGCYIFNDSLNLDYELYVGGIDSNVIEETGVTNISFPLTPSPPMTIMHNTTYYHMLPSLSVEMTQARWRAARGDMNLNYTLTNHPLPLTVQSRLLLISFLSLFAALFLLVPFCLLPATFVIFVVKERAVKAKHMQFVSGVNPNAYWISTLAWDIVNYNIIIFACMCVFLMYQDAQFSNTSMMAFCTWFTLLAYGTSVIPLSYCYSFMFNNHTNAQIGIASLHFIFGWVLVIASFILDSEETTIDTNRELKVFYRLSPSFNLGEALISLSVKSYFDTLSGSVRNPFEWEVAGRNITYMIFESFFFFVLCLSIENGVVGKALKKASSALEERGLGWLVVCVQQVWWLASRASYFVGKALTLFLCCLCCCRCGQKKRGADDDEDMQLYSDGVPQGQQPNEGNGVVLVEEKHNGVAGEKASADRVYKVEGTGRSANQPGGATAEDVDVATERERIAGLSATRAGQEQGTEILLGTESLGIGEGGSDRASCGNGQDEEKKIRDLVWMDRLTKEYPASGSKPAPTLAVDALSLGIQPGECFGFLGINGAGKTSTLKMLTGDIPSSEGNAYVNGYSIVSHMKDVRKEIGYCPQFDPLLVNMTAREQLTMYARLRGIPSSKVESVVGRLLRKLTLSQYADLPCGSYSGGNKRKLSLGLALVGNPSVVFIDEASTGMDPVSRRFMWDVISSLLDDKTSLIITTHSMEECEALCSRIGIMVHGRLTCLGTPQHLKARFGSGYHIELNTLSSDRNLTIKDFVHDVLGGQLGAEVVLLEEHPGMLKYQVSSSSLGASAGAGDIKLADIFDAIESKRAALDISEYSVSQTTLEQIFLDMAKKHI